MKTVPMTQRGASKLREELDHLKRTVRPNLIKAIAEARAHGDLRENAEYKAAREEQSFCEGRIKEVELKLATAQVIDTDQWRDQTHIVFGARVLLHHEQDDTTHEYQIVGDDEADIKERLISINSPLARGLIGKSFGDVVSIHAPAGTQYYKILQVFYGEKSD